MAPPPTSAWAQIDFVFTGPALPNSAVTTLGIAGGGDVDDTFDVMTLVWDTLLKGEFNSGVVLTELRYKNGPSDLGPSYSRSLAIPGTNSGPNDSPNVAVLVRKTVVGVTSRKGGRMFLPAPAEAGTATGGDLTGGTLTVIQAAMDALYADLVSVDADPYVFHTDSSDPTKIDRLEVQLRLATQRRRLRR